MTPRSTLPRETLDGTPQAPAAPLEESRLAMYGVLGGAVASIPVPWLPDSLLRRIRGAVAHDVASRRGVALSAQAREVLADPSTGEDSPSFAGRAVRFVGIRLAARALGRVGRVTALWPLRDAARTFLLGRLLDRYFDRTGPSRPVRMDAGEAERVRRAIDGATLRALGSRAVPMPRPLPIVDERDPRTAMVDDFLGVVVDLPARALRQMEAAFDELLARGDG